MSLVRALLVALVAVLIAGIVVALVFYAITGIRIF